MNCPVCASDNVRVSRKDPALEFLKRWRGLQRYRCRECRKVFHRPLNPGEQAKTIKPLRRRRTVRKAPDGSGKFRAALDVFIFLVMLAISFGVLRYFVS